MDFLILKKDDELSSLEIELKKSFVNIIKHLVELALSTEIRSDPIFNNYYNKTTSDVKYNELMDLATYFLSSKGGRGKLLEKAISSLTNFQSDKKIGNVINNYPLRITFDLIKIHENTLTLIELKNRIDSGGTAARNESHPKFNKIIEADTTQLLNSGISEVKMILGLLFNSDGSPATEKGDKTTGFRNSEQGETRSIVKNGVNFEVSTQYGNEFLQNLDKKLNLNLLLKTIFTHNWVDLRIAFKLCLQERIRLKESGNNIFTILKDTPTTNFDDDFTEEDIKHGKILYEVYKT